MNIQDAIQLALDKQGLSHTQMSEVMNIIMSGAASNAQIAGFLIALRCKGESVTEITAAAKVMRQLGNKVAIQGEHIIDTCGTGGDGANTFNISTTCAFVVAAAGATVAKHGNRSISSSSGSADVLEAAGVDLNLSAEQVAECVNSIGVGFLFAQKHHGAMKHVAPARKEMGVRTLFNLLGPLANPAAAPNQLIGVFAKQWVEPLAHVLKALGSEHVLVVNADDGLDEISIASDTSIAELKNGEITTYTISPEQFGLQRADLSTLAVQGAAESLAVVQSVLNNQPGPALDIVVLNAGAAIYAANLVTSLTDGVSKAQEVIASGAAKEKLQALINYKTK
ncbi:MAG: anthranilate phosphoribosyltransferase [Methyloprofundus sp.]|nr:MAG: anthranilate phosphoribosyltransferase [Methyloprofundus sp.]